MRASKIVNLVMATSVGLLATAPILLDSDVAHAASVSAPGCDATVGDATTVSLTRVDANCILKFTSGSNTWTVPNSMTSVRTLVVGGGGAGGQNGGGGGGGGAVVHNASFSVSSGANLNISVGAGGYAGRNTSTATRDGAGGPGGATTFDTLSAAGGGGGGTRYNNTSPSAINGQPGSSGGGGGGYNTTGGAGTSGGNGGNGIDLGANSAGGGGGGASGTAGTNGASQKGGNGGDGVANDITGTAVFYGGGGAGGGTQDKSAGQTWSGTPGQGGARASATATPNTGGGGGGGGWYGWGFYGGGGGSGIVILSWPGLPVAPFSTTSPSISGTAQKTATLTGSAGVWSQSPSSYTYKWKRSSTAGGSYTDIAGATGLTYTVTAEDVDKYLKFEVIATNGNGSSSEMSSATAQVTDLPNSVAATLGTPSSSASGFTVAITNFASLSSYAIAISSSAGTVSRSSGEVTVSGLSPGASATLTVTTSRSGYNDATSIMTGSSTPAPITATTTTTTTTTVGPSTTVASVTTTSEVAPTTTVSFGQTQIARVVATTTTVERAGQTAVASTTTTTTPRPVATTSAPTTTTTTIPEIAVAAPGEAAILVGGEPVESTVTRSNDQLVISAGDMAATISGITADGAVAPLDNDGNIRLSEGDQIQVEASGFAPNSDVEVWLFSTPTLLGTVTVNAQGTATATFPLPRGAESGNHRVALNGKNSAGDDASFAVGIVIGSTSGGVSTAGKVLISIPIAAAVLFALVIPARRRRTVQSQH